MKCIVHADVSPSGLIFLDKMDEATFEYDRISHPAQLHVYRTGDDGYDAFFEYGMEFDSDVTSKEEALEIFKKRVIQQWEYDLKWYQEIIDKVKVEEGHLLDNTAE